MEDRGCDVRVEDRRSSVGGEGEVRIEDGCEGHDERDGTDGG